MLFFRPVAILAILLLATASPSRSQTTSKGTVEEQIRQADALLEKGALQDSRHAYESLLNALKGAQPSGQLGHVLNGLSMVASSEGNYERAVAFAKQADDLYNQLGDVKGQAFALNNRGIAEGQLGEYAAAQASLRQALVFIRKAGDLETTVRTLNNLGNAYYFPGKYLEALRAYQEAWQVVENNRNEKWNDYWREITRINEATLYQRLARYQSALRLYKQVELPSKSLTASDQAHLLTNLGVLYRRLGDPWKALDSYNSALRLYARQHDADGEISVLKNIGIVYALDQNDLVKAQHFFEQALSRATQTHNQREEMQGHLYLGETLRRKGILNRAREEFRLALTQARKLDTKEEQWKALYGSGQTEQLAGDLGKAEADFREAIAIIETTRTQLQLSALRAEFLADKRDAYDALISLLLKKNDVEDAFSFLERSRARTFQDRLASTDSGRKTDTAALTLDEVSRYLDGSSILLEFWAAGDQVALIWCTRDSRGMVQKQLSATDLQNLRAFLRALPGNLDGNWREGIAALAGLIPPGPAQSQNLRRALVVPDGWLSSMPFDLLPLGDGSPLLLIERFSISSLPTAALLRRARPRQQSPNLPWMPQLVAFGDPLVQKRQPAAEDLEDGANLPALPYSSQEVRNIAEMAHGRAELFLRSSDLKRIFMAGKANSAEILHVSTHAFSDADSPEGSRVLFSPEGPDGSADYVFLRELYDIDLSGVNLATLSACNTERGKLIRGEGVQAFSRALLFAGSRSALTTLWRVDDQPTSEFMKQFYYFALEKHQPKAEALRSAKLKFLHSGSALQNPAHWAAFVLNGDGLDPLPRFVSWAELLASVALLIVFSFSVGLWLSLRIRRRVHRVHRSQGVVSQKA